MPEPSPRSPGAAWLPAALVLLALLAGCRAAPLPPAAPTRDAARRVVAERAAVASALPQASDAGVEMLRRGGNAVDAAVAAAFAVGVGEPQMSGLGGGGGMLIWLQAERRAEYLDFYASGLPATFAPGPGGAARQGRLLRVAIPGEVAGLLAAHERFGRLPRAEVLAPAIRLAEQGVPVGQVLARAIAADSARLWRDPDARGTFWPGGRPLRPGDRLRQPELAATLRRIAGAGRAGFYAGEVAAAVAAELNRGGHPATPADLAAYAPRWKRPLCAEYRGRVVLSAPPPQSGMQVLETLRLLEARGAAGHGLPSRSAAAFDLLASALRVGGADARFNGDPNWGHVPAAGAASDGFVAARAALVGTGSAAPGIASASPAPFEGEPPSPGCAPLDPYSAPPPPPQPGEALGPASGVGPAGGETTHLSVVDPEGNAVSLTQTNSSLFGSGARVAGFFLNDSGVDFARTPPTAVGRDPWYTRRSTIAPTILLRDGRVELVIGAPGDDQIPAAIVQTILYTLDFGLDPLDAVLMPRLFAAPDAPAVELEGGFPASVLEEVRGMGYRPSASTDGYARVYVVQRRAGRWIAVADPRHDGEPRGY